MEILRKIEILLKVTILENSEGGAPRRSFGRRIEWHTQFGAKPLHFAAMKGATWTIQSTSDDPSSQWMLRISLLNGSLDAA